MSGNYKLWSTDMNKDGFMGFVDKWWIFWNRIGVIIALIGLTLSILTSIVAIVTGKQQLEESYKAPRRYRYRRRA